MLYYAINRKVMYLVHCTWYIVLGPLYLVHCTRTIVSGTLYLVHRIWYIVPGPFVSGTLYLVHCIWYIVPGTLYLVGWYCTETTLRQSALQQKRTLCTFSPHHHPGLILQPKDGTMTKVRCFMKKVGLTNIIVRPTFFKLDTYCTAPHM